ncbi:hypothetical protein B296_00034453 [Ensete ventricosum]|uniref:Uncharacterized protein n=1 Tax=Ensete ventricosum TaxID=4639 RepID=A0A426X3V9_ENSVE|nr:hypothetical protein B296_00034453 [Ensete ventricosum]
MYEIEQPQEKVAYYDIATEKRAEFEKAMAAYIKRKVSDLFYREVSFPSCVPTYLLTPSLLRPYNALSKLSCRKAARLVRNLMTMSKLDETGEMKICCL